MKGRLWVTQSRGGRRLHSQRVHFAAWPEAMKCLEVRGDVGAPFKTERVEVIQYIGEVVQFSTRNTHYELEKLAD